MDKATYNDLTAQLARLKEHIDNGNKQLQNRQLMELIALLGGCLNANGTDTLSANDVCIMCRDGKIDEILTAAKRHGGRMLGEKLEQTRTSIAELESKVEESKKELGELKAAESKEGKLRAELDRIQQDIANLKDSRQKLKDGFGTLVSFGINVNVDEKNGRILNLEEVRAEVGRKTRATSDSASELGKLSSSLRAVQAKYDSNKADLVEQSLKLLDNNEEELAKLSEEAQSTLKYRRDNLQKRLDELKSTRENIAALTLDIDKTSEKLEKYITAFRKHKEENRELYKRINGVGAESMSEVMRRIESYETKVDEALVPYDLLLAQLKEEKQKDMDAIVSRIENSYDIELKPLDNK